MTDEQTPPKPNWQALAQDALDLWQSHLAALAQNQPAKDEMAKMLGPMNQMFADWSKFMTPPQQKPEGKPDASPTPPQPPSAASAEPQAADQPVADASVSSAPAGTSGSTPARDRDPVAARHDILVQLAAHVAELDERLGRIERLLASAAAKSNG